jgi:hypothetical protein
MGSNGEVVSRRGISILSGTRAGRAAIIAIIGAGIVGLLERIWLLTHLHLFGDEAVVGLMAHQIGSGHPTAFYWGQTYGGVEPYVAALAGFANSGPIGLNATPMVLSILASVLIGAIVAEVTDSRPLGMLSAALAWIWPYAYVWNSVREGGFRFATLCCGLGMVLCAVRIQRGGDGRWTCLFLGLTAGVGWWASPEIIYFAIPTIVLIVIAVVTGVKRAEKRVGGRAPWLRGRVVTAVFGALVGAIPWIYANVHNGFSSLNLGSQVTSSGTSFGGRLSTFFHQILPVQLGLRALFTGAWLGGSPLGHVLMILVLLVIIVAGMKAISLARWGDPCPVALGLGVAALPFLMAANPATGYWVDGRYGVYVGPIIIVFLFSSAGTASPSARKRAHRQHQVRARRTRALPCPLSAVVAVGAATVVVAGILTVIDGQIVSATPVIGSSAYFTSWHDPDQPIRQAASDMTRAHIKYAYGTYWTSYDLDFLAPGRVVVTPSSLDFNRWAATANEVARAKRPSWLFFPPARIAAATVAFSNPQVGPGSYSEQAFLALLKRMGIGYHVVHLGILDAVTPDRAVTLP